MRLELVILVLVSFFLIGSSALRCQLETSKYWVFLTDKDGVKFDPYSYFDEKAIERREKLGIDLYDQTDFPVKQLYIDQVLNEGVEVLSESRWFNVLTVIASVSQIKEVEKLSCVSEIQSFSHSSLQLAEVQMDTHSTTSGVDSLQIKLIHAQTDRMGRRDFARNGIDGKNVRVAIFDAGFTDANVNGCFKHIYKDNRVIDTYDFVKNEKDVYHGSHHGTAVWSCIAGITTESEFGSVDTLGLATGAEFLLARTERALIEVYSEEENWLAAVEWADKNGADVINSSLGYTGHRYTFEQMDGTGTLVSRAGNLAAKKGILVVNSAGNDGSNHWNFVGAPADADSVLAVGGLMPWTGLHTNFSSVGPTYDYRLKPNVTAYGHVIGARREFISETQGTSFSSPLMAGFAACAWQANPGWNNMELFHELEKGADLYPYFDYAHGYGVPMAVNFIREATKEEVFKNHILEETGGLIKVNVLTDTNYEEIDGISEKEMALGIFKIDCKLDYRDHLFYHFEDAKGNLLAYYVVNMEGEKIVYTKPIPKEAVTFRSYFGGYAQELKLRDQ
ncbi:MAG: S8 family serine peptidase [Flavobacteriales bacterium]